MLLWQVVHPRLSDKLVVGTAIFNIWAYLRRRKASKDLARKASLRTLKLCDSPLPDKIISAKRDQFLAQSLIEVGHSGLQPPEKARTPSYMTRCYASEAVKWVPQIRSSSQYMQNLSKTIDVPPSAFPKTKSRTFASLQSGTPMAPMSESHFKASDTASTESDSSTLELSNPPYFDDKASVTTIFPTHVESNSPETSGPISLEQCPVKKTRRKPPPLVQPERYSLNISRHVGKVNNVDSIRSDGDDVSTRIPIITVSEVTQALVIPPKVDMWVNRSPRRSDSTFPTSPSPSDLGLASPLSSSLTIDEGSSSRRRDSMAKGNTTGDVGSQLPRLVVVVKMYLPTLNDELAVKCGEILRLRKEFKDGWCAVERLSSEERGVLPRFCVSEPTLDFFSARKRRTDRWSKTDLRNSPSTSSSPRAF